MSENPHAPPETPPEPRPYRRDARDVHLFSPLAIAAHVVFFTPLAGALLAAVNYRRLGNTLAFWRTVLLFVAPSLVVNFLMFGNTGPASPAVRKLMMLVFEIGMAWTLYREHHPLMQKHLEAGGQTARWYLATLAMIAFLLFGLAAWQFLSPGRVN